MTRTETAILVGAMTLGLLGALAVAEPWPAALVGEGHAIDGDTVRVGATRVRLAWIDAPEAAQTCQRAPTGLYGASYACGEVATAALRYMLARDPVVTCQAKATDRYQRTVAVCSNSEGDLGARMVAAGHAVAARRYSAAYVDHEAAAKAERLGIWAGSFTMPEQYRRDHRK